MSLWTRVRRWWQGLRAAKTPAPAPSTLPALPPKGALDVRSNDLGDRSGWLQRNYTYTRFDEIQTAVVSDALLLTACFLSENLARQGGVTLEPAKGENLSERKSKLAHQEVARFLESVQSPLGESFEELFFRCVGELAKFHNFALSLAWQSGTIRNLALLPWISMNLCVDSKGVPTHWVQFDYNLRREAFELSEICHGVLNRQAGDRYGTPTLEPTAGDDGDLKAFRAVEAMAGQQLQHLVFPTRLVNFGTPEYPETDPTRQAANKQALEDMEREGYLCGSGRVSLQSDAPTPMDPHPLLQHFKQRVVQPTGWSRVRLGEGLDISVATAEVLAAGEHQNLLSLVQAVAAAIRQGVFVPLLAARGIPAAFAPSLVPGEPDPVRRQKYGEGMAKLYQTYGVATREEARRANGLPELPPGEKPAAPPKKETAPSTDPATDESEPTVRREKRVEERTK